MGFKSHSIKNIFNSKIKISQYPSLSGDTKEMVDFTIKENLLSNQNLRISNRSTVQPKTNNFWYMKWSDIIELRMAVSEHKMFDAMNIVFGISEKQYMNLELFNAFAVYNWIIQKFKEIIDAEVEQLSFENTVEELEAGAKDLEKFGYSVALDGIAKGDLLKYDEYLNLPYSKIFRKMCLDKTRYEINKNLQENASRKTQTNS